MTDKELRRLTRADLLEMLAAQGREKRRLEEELAEARERLADRGIQIKEAGSIAEAALRLSGVFEAAQAAADQYLENVKRAAGAPGDAPRE